MPDEVDEAIHVEQGGNKFGFFRPRVSPRHTKAVDPIFFNEAKLVGSSSANSGTDWPPG
jgi:hypothetical protein